MGPITGVALEMDQRAPMEGLYKRGARLSLFYGEARGMWPSDGLMVMTNGIDPGS